MTATDIALIGLLMVCIGGILKGIADRLVKNAATRTGYDKEPHWITPVLYVLGYAMGGAGFLWHGHMHVSDFWSLTTATALCFIAWGLGYSVTRPR